MTAPRILASYRVQAACADIERVAEAIALEQSVEVPRAAVHDRFVAEQVVGCVEGIAEVAQGSYEVRIGLAAATVGSNPAQLLNMAFGNSSLKDNVELVGLELPQEVLAMLPGPRFGVAGWRRTGQRAPLTCAALKPQGLSAERLASLAYTLAEAGVDVIKDDHGLADQAYAPFEARVHAVQEAIERAADATGHQAIYAPSVVGSPRFVTRQVQTARDAGARAILLAPSLLGLPAFAEVVAEVADVPVLAHPAFAGTARIAHPLLIGLLYRLFGADAVIFPHSAGRFAFSQEDCLAIAHNALRPLGSMAPALPVPAGGLALESLGPALDLYGDDVMLLVGGALLLEPAEVGLRARQFVEAVRTRSERIHA